MLLLLIAALLLGGCSDGHDSNSDRKRAAFPHDPFAGLEREGRDVLTRAEIERAAAVKLPARARRLHSYFSRALDTMVLVSFTVDRPGMEQFIADSGVKGGLKTGTLGVAPPDGGELGWNLAGIRSFAGARDRTRDGVYRRFTVDLDDPQQPVVYLLAFGT